MMPLSRTFWIVLGVMLVLFLLPSIRTANAPSWDGSQMNGNPFIYSTYGGMCYESGQPGAVVC